MSMIGLKQNVPLDDLLILMPQQYVWRIPYLNPLDGGFISIIKPDYKEKFVNLPIAVHLLDFF